MNTDRHERITRTRHGGLDEIRAGFERIGRRDVRLEAFFLGNWINDLSQVIDPPAFPLDEEERDAVKETIRAALGELSTAIQRATANGGMERIGRRLRTFVNEVNSDLQIGLDRLLGSTGGDPRNTLLYDHLRDVSRFAGYFKFVHPERPGGSPRMDFGAYKAVFDHTRLRLGTRPEPFEAGFTQYYPHEHLDRPPAPEERHSKYASGLSRGGTPMYDYLKKDLKILAGTWSWVEREWAQPIFDLGEPFDDTNPDWNIRLAIFGKAMHMAEDFYAHSNFVELAAGSLSRRFQQDALPTRRHRETAIHRLQRWAPGTQRGAHGGIEINVVTGYFDGKDFLFALVHILEELFGLRFIDPERDARRTGQRLARDPVRFLKQERQRLLVETNEIIADPEAAFRDETNATAGYLRQRNPEFVEQLLRELQGPGATLRDVRAIANFRQNISERTIEVLLSDGELWDDVPQDVKLWFASAMGNLGTILRLRGCARSVYEVIEMIVALYTSLDRAIEMYRKWIFWRSVIPPVGHITSGARIVRWLPLIPLAAEPTSVLFNTLLRLSGGAIATQIRHAFYNALGGNDIGSHSLLAKDSDDSEPFANHALQLAIGMHWYVAKVMVRNYPPHPPPGHRRTDWLDIAKFFLRHPRPEPSSRLGDPWWRRILQRSNWLAGPNGTSRFPPDYGHSLLFITEDRQNRLIQEAKTLRIQAEQAYV